MRMKHPLEALITEPSSLKALLKAELDVIWASFAQQ